MDWNAALKTVIETARAAGALLLHGREAAKVIERKSTAIDLVTEYDLAAEKLILARLQAEFPDYPVHAEESGPPEQAGDYAWYVDPLDGTVNFAHSFPVFAVSIALCRAGTPLLGVVYDPNRDETFQALAGAGAWLTQGDAGRRPLRVTQTARLLDSLLATGFAYDNHTSAQDNLAQFGAFLKRTQGIRRAGAASLDLAYVAAGRLDGYWEFKLKNWDVAAGWLLVQEAGGRVTNIQGASLQLDGSPAVVASNGRLHAAMLELLREG